MDFSSEGLRGGIESSMIADFKEVAAGKIMTEAKGYLAIGFTHSLNPYSGCAFACKYCYVREMPIQRFKGMPWGQWVEAKTNAAERYREEIRKLRSRKKTVNLFMSSATDPYQPIEREANITRGLLEAMLEHPPDMLQIQTRGPLIARDLELLVKLKETCTLIVSMTIETDREEIRRIFAPAAPGVRLRMKVLKELHDAGIFTQAAISPVLPFTPEFPALLEGVADRIWIDTLMIGDGSLGKRSERLGMPQLFAAHDLSNWYRDDLHHMAEKCFRNVFPRDRIHVSRAGAFPQI
jgi:DNA repair photolyase